MPVFTAGRVAAATSILALTVAMGGTGFAAAKISGDQIKNNAITGQKVRNNTLSGADVDESSLAKVPSARTADAATSADSARTAGSVGGVTPSTVLYRSHTTPPQTIFTGGGLSINASCEGPELALTATTTTVASIYASLTDLETPQVLASDEEGGAFRPGEDFDLTAGATKFDVDPALITFEYDTPAGRVITGTLATDTFNNDASDCSVTGHVLVS